MSDSADLEASTRRQTICAVPGCFNNTSARFAAPDDYDKRKKWLKLIHREDLMSQTNLPIHVCENHFEASSILIAFNGKMLKPETYPKINLPRVTHAHTRLMNFFNLPKKTPAVPLFDKEVQTDPIPPASKVDEVKCSFCRKRIKPDDGWAEYEIFTNLCDKFLTKNLAILVKQKAIFMVKEKR